MPSILELLALAKKAAGVTWAGWVTLAVAVALRLGATVLQGRLIGLGPAEVEATSDLAIIVGAIGLLMLGVGGIRNLTLRSRPVSKAWVRRRLRALGFIEPEIDGELEKVYRRVRAAYPEQLDALRFFGDARVRRFLESEYVERVGRERRPSWSSRPVFDPDGYSGYGPRLHDANLKDRDAWRAECRAVRSLLEQSVEAQNNRARTRLDQRIPVSVILPADAGAIDGDGISIKMRRGRVFVDEMGRLCLQLDLAINNCGTRAQWITQARFDVCYPREGAAPHVVAGGLRQTVEWVLLGDLGGADFPMDDPVILGGGLPVESGSYFLRRATLRHEMSSDYRKQLSPQHFIRFSIGFANQPDAVWAYRVDAWPLECGEEAAITRI